MTKTKRTLSTLVLSLLTLAVTAVFAACGGDGKKPQGPADDSIAYTVKVLCGETPAVGTDVKISNGGVDYGSGKTGADGVASFSLAPGDYVATLDPDTIPDHYELASSDPITLTQQNPDATVTLVRKFAYEVKLVRENGDAAIGLSGVTVQICSYDENGTGNCLSPVALEGSTAYVEADKKNYHIKVNGLPETLAYPCDAEGYSTESTLSATETAVEVKLYAVNALTERTMTAAQKTAYAEANPAYTQDEQKKDAVMSEKITLAPGKSAYYAFTAPRTGAYKLFAMGFSTYFSLGNTFVLEDGSKTIFGTSSGTPVNMEKGKRYYFIANNMTEESDEVQIIIAFPATTTATVDKLNATTNKATTEVTIYSEGACATVELVVPSPAAYKVTVGGETLANLKFKAFSPDEFGDYDADATFVKGATDSRKFTSPATVYYAVSVKNAQSYPLTVAVEVEKLNNITNNENTVAVKETLVQQTVPQNKELKYLPMDGTATLVYNETDKFYHLGTADGAIVYVNITEMVDDSRFDFGGLALAYLDMDLMANISYVFDVTSEADKADLTKGTTHDDYSLFIRGFKELEYDKIGNPVKPENLTQENCYANFVNDDGVYPLTEELEKLIKLIVETYAIEDPEDPYAQRPLSWAFPASVNDENLWLFPLCYYGDKLPEAPADPIVGEYTADGEYINDHSKQTLVLKINKDNTFTIRKIEDDESYDSGTWSKSNDTYTFECREGTLIYSNGTVTYNDQIVEATFDLVNPPPPRTA